MLHLYPPAPPLRPYVQHYLLATADYSGLTPAEAVRPMPPAPAQCLYFYPRAPVHAFNYGRQQRQPLPRSILVGPQVSRVDLHFEPDHLVLCVAFWPGGLHRLLGVPVRELFDFPLDSTELLGRPLAELSEQLAETPDPAAMPALVESYLLRALRRLQLPTRPIDAVLPQLLQLPALPSVEALAHEACLSPRQFERSFVERVGMGPKLYARIVRFDRAFRLKEQHPNLDWLTVALRCGYYDYRHLVRDFQAFAGTTPPQLLLAAAAHEALLSQRRSRR